MSTQHPVNEPQDNERSLQQLAWTLQASVGQFKLIWARCNYSDLRTRLIERLSEISKIKIQVLQLKESERTLYTAIREKLQPDAQALMIVGWESLQDLPQMLTSANQVREEFRKNLSIPVVVWISEEIHHIIMEIAPDLESWGTSRSFAIAPADLAQFIKQLADEYFSGNFSVKDYRILELELEAAQRDILADSPEIEANLASALGFVKQTNNKIDEALEYYQKAFLLLWQQLNSSEKQVRILGEIAYCYYLKAIKNKDISHPDWQATRQYTQEYITYLNETNRQDLAASSIAKFGNILRDLKEWEQLQKLAEQALQVHQANNQLIELAKDYGFLAQVALPQSRWSKAKQLALRALDVLPRNSGTEAINNTEVVPDLSQESLKLHDSSFYKYILAQAEYELGLTQEAIVNLESARDASSPIKDLQLHLDILSYLQRVYFEKKEYLKAYNTKQQQRSIEQQFGLRAFIGAGRLQSTKLAQVALTKTGIQETIAPEITASGRLLDIERLVERLGRHDHKLIVINGQSGVGKSSLVNAGLVPALKNKSVGIQDYLPVAMRVYTNWVEELGRSLQQALHERRGAVNEQALGFEVDALIAQLRENEQHNLRTVLIFDQFEEFFFVYTEPKHRQQFFEFLGECLNILSVKVILSLRVDYLHYLLECDDLPSMTIIGNDLLSKNVLYKLGNFSPDDTKLIIQRLTETTSFYLEPTLIEQLVQDLASELGKVRPIELQIVGAQLQTENITTLREYQRRGTKEELVKRYLAEVVNDCGIENQQAAELLLYLLTDEQGIRPLKTRAELERDLQQYIFLMNLSFVNNIPNIILNKKSYTNVFNFLKNKFLNVRGSRNKKKKALIVMNLDLILEIFIKSGLVTFLPENPADRYQLVHDYLALFIRHQQEPQLKLLLAHLEEEKKLRKLTETRLNRFLRIALAASVLAILGLSVSIVTVLNSEIKTLSASSEVLFASQKGIDALKEALKGGRKLQQAVWVDSNTREQLEAVLYQIVYTLREYNRLEGHLSGVNSVTFSQDQSLIASASADSTIKLWRLDGTLVKTLSGHTDVVNSVSFSPDAQIIASASQDKTVKLWSHKGQLLTTLLGHQAVVNSVAWSPDGQIIASASTDKTVKLWTRQGKLLKTLTGHSNAVLGVAWSPDGQIIASASTDQTVKLWNREGKLLKTLSGHDDAVKGVAWSPDGQTIASASLDQTIKLWSREGKLLKTLAGHSAGVTSVSFSPDGNTIASASTDETLKLWSPQGVLLGTLRGHNNWVNTVTFSPDSRTLASASGDKTIKLWRWDDVLQRNPTDDNDDWVTGISFSPSDRIIAAASRDKTVKLWTRDGKLLNILKGHQGEVWGVSFSPNGEVIASASKDKTVKLWNRDGKLLNTFKGHNDAVLSVAWSPDGQQIASASQDKTVKLWSRDGKLLNTFKGHNGAVNWVSFSPDGRLLASASDDKTVKLWNRDGQLLYTLTGHSRRVNGVAWSPDSQTIASVSIDSTVKLWSKDGNLINNLTGDGDSFVSVSFSPDGKTLVASSDDKVRLWNREGTLIIVLKDDKGELTSVSFSVDGKTLAAGSGDGTMIFRDLADIKLENLLSRGCNLLQDYLKTNPKVTKSDRTLCQQGLY